MSRARYEPVPQRDEIIILDSINSPSYNYNTGIPSSASSIASHPQHSNPSHVSAPQYGRPPSIAPNIPSSPPPSFHSHSRSGTPRPTPSTTASADYAELWGVAPSTIAGETTASAPRDPAADITITQLRNRIERLEESIGRLLLEKEERDNDSNGDRDHSSGNCCVTFSDMSPELERALTQRGGNCCVSLKSSKDGKREHVRGMIVVLGLMLMVCAVLVTIVVVGNGQRSGGRHLSNPVDLVDNSQ